MGGYGLLAIAAPDSAGVSAITYVHSNHLGVPIVYTDASGVIVQPGSYAQPVFPGQAKTLADLYYNRYRDYDPTTGRYIQADPIGLAGGPSPYSYAMNNPVRYVDPMGLKCVNFFDASDGNFRKGADAECGRVDPNNSPTDLHIFGHANAEQICIGGGICRPADNFYEENQSHFDGMTSISVWGCNAGRGNRSVAQRLADRARIPVSAYDRETWWNANGFQGSAGTEPTLWERLSDWWHGSEQHTGSGSHTGRNSNDPGTLRNFTPQ
jgi:RHS repeat-associated protein